MSGSGACALCRTQLGPYVLGQADDAERRTLQAHLAGSPACAADAERPGAVAALLPLADHRRLEEATPSPSPQLAVRIEQRINAERTDMERVAARRNRRRGIALALVAAAVALIAGIGIAVQLSRDDGTIERQLVAIGADPVRAQARLAERPWGTSVTIEASGLSVGTTYGAWLERADGSRVVAGTFRADTPRVLVTLSAAIPLSEGRAVGVSTVDGEDVLRAPL